LADRGLLRPKSQDGLRSAAGEEFPAEGTSETVVFLAAHRARVRRLGRRLPAGLLHFYRIELVQLAPKSITIIATFVHLYEAYLNITPHFHLWPHFFELKKMGKGVVVGGVGFMLRRNMKSEYVDLTLPDNTTGWKQGWFYLDNPASTLKERTGWAPVPYSEWTNQLASRDTEELQPLLDDLEQLKADGLTGAAVAISLYRRLIQPLQDRTHPAFEYWGQSDPTRVAQCKVSKAEMMACAKNIFGERICNRNYPKALGVYSLSDPLSHRP
jgi:hypothetical protein